MKRERPLGISIICIFLFVIHLFPSSGLLHKAFELGQTFSNGGIEAFYSAYKATVTPADTKMLGRLLVVFIGIGGLWVMKQWSVYLVAGGVAWGLFEQAQLGNFGLVGFVLPVIAVTLMFIFFYQKPKTRVHSPKVHYYSTESSSLEEIGGTSRPEGEKSAVDDIIY